jgi:hypothetical protein
MTKELTIKGSDSKAQAIEKALVGGNLKDLPTEARVAFYKDICESLGLNWRTSPFQYLEFQGSLKLYASKDCTEQLRKIHGVSITSLDPIPQDGGVYVVRATATDKTGRTDSSIGAVVIDGKRGVELCNAIMKAETKAKRRLTLSICGLGMLDESELDGLQGYRVLSPEEAHSEAVMLQEAPSLPPEQKALPEASLTFKYDIPNANRKQELFLEKRGFSPNPVTGYWEGPLNLGPKMEQFLVKEDA